MDDITDEQRSIVGAVERTSTRLIARLDPQFIVVTCLILFLIWQIRDVQSERIDAMRAFAVACTEALVKSTQGHQP